MEIEENLVPKRILDRLDALLTPDGFRQSIPCLFVKNLEAEWRAWFVVPGYSCSLLPAIGLYNEGILNIARAARAKLCRPSLQKPDTGPPLIIANLESVIGDDPACRARITWNFEVEDRHIADPASVPELKTEVADDLAFCLRRRAYPFFAAHMTFQGIWDAAHDGTAIPSPAFPNYFPIILMKLGRRNDVPRYLDETARQIRNENVSKAYREYVNTLLEMNPA